LSNATGDQLLTLTLLNGEVRVFICVTTRLAEEARRTHAMSRTATAALGRLLTVGIMMGAMLKTGGDSVTLTVKGGGPIGQLVAVARPDGTIKGYAVNPKAELPLNEKGKLDVGGVIGRQGQLTVIRDMGLREPYVGQVNLVSGEIGEDFAYYFTTSEQAPSLVSVGVRVGERVTASGGLIIQPMPGCQEAALLLLEMRVPDYAELSAALERGTALEALCEEYFEGLEPKILARITPEYRCDCNRSRIERALVTLGRDEIEDMIKLQGGAHMTCHFCNHEYTLEAAELRALID